MWSGKGIGRGRDSSTAEHGGAFPRYMSVTEPLGRVTVSDAVAQCRVVGSRARVGTQDVMV